LEKECSAGFRQKIRSLDTSLTKPLVLPEKRRLIRFCALGLAHSGDLPIWVAMLAIAWICGNDAWKLRAVITLAGLALVEIVVIGVKTIVRRQRPPGSHGLVYRKADPYSFPSGHAARAVLLSLVAMRLGPDTAFIAIIAWSPLMVISRIAIGIHYVLDIIAGAMLGALLTAILLQVAAIAGAQL
jgi:undecaprenyl-diphosphatase